MGTAIDLTFRVTSILFTGIIFVLSASLVANPFQCKPVPFVLGGALFVGVATVCGSVVVLVSNLVEFLEGKFMLILDGTLVMANHVGGIVSRNECSYEKHLSSNAKSASSWW